MNFDKSSSESALWDKILHQKIQCFMTKTPMTPINEVIADSTKEYLEQKWISLTDPEKRHLDIDQYLEFGDKFGPDLTAIPRYRFDTKLLKKSSTGQPPKRYTNYDIFRKEMKGKLSQIEIQQKWKSLSAEEKDKYKLSNQDNS